MKRSTNLAYTRAARSYLSDTALFLRDLGMTDDGIKAVISEMHTGKDEPSNNAVHLTSAADALSATNDTEPQAQVTANR